MPSSPGPARRRWPVWFLTAATLAGAAAVVERMAWPQQRTPTHIAVPPPAEDGPAGDPGTLRVCADPNNLPFSNARGEGFENQIMALVAADMGKRLAYYWEPQRRGFIRTTLRAGRCDVIAGIASAVEMARMTRPYYRSTYVFVSRRDSGLRVTSMDDPRLHRVKVGLQLTGEDYENPPPAQALAARGIVHNVTGFMVYGDYLKPDPLRTPVDAVADRRIDLAIMWGPTAAYFARRVSVPLAIDPVTPQVDVPFLPFVYDISMGVRRQDTGLAQALDDVIVRRAAEIRGILERFGVPLVHSPGTDADRADRSAAAARTRPGRS
jgi:mxaJ protein